MVVKVQYNTVGAPGSQNTYNDYYNLNKYSNSVNDSFKTQYINTDKKNMPPTEFVVKEIEEDPSIGQMTKAIYVKGEPEWIGVD